MSSRLAPWLVSPFAMLSCVDGTSAERSLGTGPSGAAAPSPGSFDGGAEVDVDAQTWGEWTVLFDGALTADWRMSTIRNQPGRDDPGHFTVEDGALVSHAGTDLGLLWHARPTPPDFELALEWRLSTQDGNSGVFVRFPDPESKGYDNSAWVAVDFGFEVQIDESGAPDGAPEHTTGAIYGEPNQTFERVVARPPGEWNAFSIRCVGDVVSVMLNDRQVTRYQNTRAGRGAASTPSAPAYVGLQTHAPSSVSFRNIRIRSVAVTN